MSEYSHTETAFSRIGVARLVNPEAWLNTVLCETANGTVPEDKRFKFLVDIAPQVLRRPCDSEEIKRILQLPADVYRSLSGNKDYRRYLLKGEFPAVFDKDVSPRMVSVETMPPVLDIVTAESACPTRCADPDGCLRILRGFFPNAGGDAMRLETRLGEYTEAIPFCTDKSPVRFICVNNVSSFVTESCFTGNFCDALCASHATPHVCVVHERRLSLYKWTHGVLMVAQIIAFLSSPFCITALAKATERDGFPTTTRSMIIYAIYHTLARTSFSTLKGVSEFENILFGDMHISSVPDPALGAPRPTDDLALPMAITCAIQQVHSPLPPIEFSARFAFLVRNVMRGGKATDTHWSATIGDFCARYNKNVFRMFEEQGPPRPRLVAESIRPSLPCKPASFNAPCAQSNTRSARLVLLLGLYIRTLVASFGPERAQQFLSPQCTHERSECGDPEAAHVHRLFASIVLYTTRAVQMSFMAAVAETSKDTDTAAQEMRDILAYVGHAFVADHMYTSVVQAWPSPRAGEDLSDTLDGIHPIGTDIVRALLGDETAPASSAEQLSQRLFRKHPELFCTRQPVPDFQSTILPDRYEKLTAGTQHFSLLGAKDCLRCQMAAATRGEAPCAKDPTRPEEEIYNSPHKLSTITRTRFAAHILDVENMALALFRELTTHYNIKAQVTPILNAIPDPSHAFDSPRIMAPAVHFLIPGTIGAFGASETAWHSFVSALKSPLRNSHSVYEPDVGHLIYAQRADFLPENTTRLQQYGREAALEDIIAPCAANPQLEKHMCEFKKITTAPGYTGVINSTCAGANLLHRVANAPGKLWNIDDVRNAMVFVLYGRKLMYNFKSYECCLYWIAVLGEAQPDSGGGIVFPPFMDKKTWFMMIARWLHGHTQAEFYRHSTVVSFSQRSPKIVMKLYRMFLPLFPRQALRAALSRSIFLPASDEMDCLFEKEDVSPRDRAVDYTTCFSHDEPDEVKHMGVLIALCTSGLLKASVATWV